MKNRTTPNKSYSAVKFRPLQTTSGTVLNLFGSRPGCTSGVYYRAGVIANVFNSDGVGESITVYSDPVRRP